MAPTVPFGEPSQIRAGDTATWDIAPAEFPYSEGWAISYALTGKTTLTWSSNYVAQNGEGYRITIPASATDDLSAGLHRWVCHATLSSARYQVAAGRMEILPNLAVATGSALQLHAEKMVELYEAALILRTSPTSTAGGENLIEKYGVAGREVEKMSTVEVEQALARARAKVAQLRGGGIGVKVPVYFTSPR